MGGGGGNGKFVMDNGRLEEDEGWSDNGWLENDKSEGKGAALPQHSKRPHLGRGKV